MQNYNVKNRNLIFLNEFKILFFAIFLFFTIGLIGQLSASNGEINAFVQRYCAHAIFGLCVMFAIYALDLRVIFSYAYLCYAIVLISLVAVSLMGVIRLGAQRWINLGFFTFQPSELMKLVLIQALARYYSLLTPFEITLLRNHFLPILLTLIPTVLVLKQPDLGSAFLILSSGIGVIFLSGFPKKIFAAITVFSAAICPFGWFFLHDYQKNRILTFLDPDRDPCGTGYHVLQSKIAIGSGGFWGKGFLEGSQSKLDFLPEKNTDFIFTTISEEFGFFGSCIIILLFFGIISYFFWAASKEKTTFSRLLCGGLGILLFLHAFVNMAMVMGILPVVGIPLPFLSYGGSSMLTFMISCGLVMCALSSKKV